MRTDILQILQVLRLLKVLEVGEICNELFTLQHLLAGEVLEVERVAETLHELDRS